MSDAPVLPEGLPTPMPLPDGLDAPYWEGTRNHELKAQRCNHWPQLPPPALPPRPPTPGS